MKILYIVAITMMLSGCASTPQEVANQDINTVAKPQLQRDVIKMIGIYESALGGSRVPKIVKVEHIDTKQENGVVQLVKERWVVDSNGQPISYLVDFIPSPTGGTDFGVTRQKTP